MKELAYANKFAIRLFSEIGEAGWDSFVKNNRMGHASYLYKIVEMNQGAVDPQKECDSVENISFAIYEKEQLVLIMPLYKKTYKDSEDGALRYELISKIGILVKDDLCEKYRRKLSAFFISYLERLLFECKNKKLRTELPGMCSINNPNNPIIVNPLIYFGFSPSVRYTSVVNLNKDENRILADCEETTRQVIRKYLDKEDYYMEETQAGNLERDFESLFEMSEETYARTHGVNYSNRFYRDIFEYSPDIFRIFFIKEHRSNKALAAAVIQISNNIAKYYVGVSVNDRPDGLNKYLIYRIMLELKKSGIEYFETGGAYPYLPQTAKRRGIGDFKKSFGTVLHIVHGGVFYSNDLLFWKEKIKMAKKEYKERGTITM